MLQQVRAAETYTRAELNAETAAGERPHLSTSIDDYIRALMAQRFRGASPLSLATAAFDWSLHMATAPGRCFDLYRRAAQIGMRSWERVYEESAREIDNKTEPAGASSPISPVLSANLRAYARAFDELDAWIDIAADAAPGVSNKHRDLVRFAGRQALEPMRPDNFLFTNSEALARTAEERGANLMRGWFNWLEDFAAARGRNGASKRAMKLKVGADLAAAKGSVVFRNELIELIQYAPTTQKVRAEPILITPAWIMKYYILDLSPHNSLVRYLTDQGFTVFMISWRNPDAEDAALSFDDYRRLGVLAALDAVGAIAPGRRVHAVGYCLGGTLLAITAAALARSGDRRLSSLTLLAAQTDFRDAGELSIFIDEEQLHWLDAAMESNGVLNAEQMGFAFQALRSRDLIWRRRQRAYLLGERDEEFDLMVWNQDATRMPYRMHSEYLRRLFLNNDFVQGRFDVDGAPAAVSDIRAPIFALGTEKDHVAPWRSVFKIHLFADTEVTFALTNGGHNAGVVSEPGRPRRRHRVLTKPDCEHYIAPDDWLEAAETVEGSWWPTWRAWLDARSTDEIAPPPIARAAVDGNALPDGGPPPEAPGEYVFG